MTRLGELLGSATRGNIVEALALSGRPLTAYRIAKNYNMNVAKVYLGMKKLERLGLVRFTGKIGLKEYELNDNDLRSLALRLSSRVQTLESWRSDESRRSRFRMGLVPVPRFSLENLPKTQEPRQRRMPGELENLATLGRKMFDAKYRRKMGRDYDRV
jgi:hypothetical protein